MNNLKKDILTCPNCGAPINRLTMRCEYCGAVFKEDVPNIVVQMEHSKVMPVRAEAFIDYYISEHVPKEDLTRMVSSELTRKIADGLSQLMEIKVQDDPLRCGTLIVGTVRVVPPGEKL